MQYLDILKCRVLGAWNYFLSFPEQFPQVLKAGNSIYMKFEHKKNILLKLIHIFSLWTKSPFLQQQKSLVLKTKNLWF